VQDSNGDTFPVMEMDGKHYVRARTGQEFQVIITILRELPIPEHRSCLGNR